MLQQKKSEDVSLSDPEVLTVCFFPHNRFIIIIFLRTSSIDRGLGQVGCQRHVLLQARVHGGYHGPEWARRVKYRNVVAEGTAGWCGRGGGTEWECAAGDRGSLHRGEDMCRFSYSCVERVNVVNTLYSYVVKSV